jgi:hypothetical protein
MLNQKLPDKVIQFYRSKPFIIDTRKKNEERPNLWAFWGWVLALSTGAMFWGTVIALFWR